MSLLVLFSLLADLVLARRLCRRLRSSLLATSFGGSGLWLAASVIVSREVAEFLLGLGPQELELLAVLSVSWCIDGIQLCTYRAASPVQPLLRS